MNLDRLQRTGHSVPTFPLTYTPNAASQIENKSTIQDKINGTQFEKFAQASKLIHTFKYFLNRNEEHKELNLSNGTFVNSDLYKTIQLVTHEEFNNTLDLYFETVIKLQQNKDLWVDNNVPGLFTAFDKDSKPIFEPYTAKSLSPAGTEYVIFPDLHGDINSLIAVIEELITNGYITSSNPLTLKSSCQFVFTGDFTDRGLWGAEVIYLLMLLKIHNPTSVHLLRGNHEDGEMTANLGFYQECKAKFGEDGFNLCQNKIEHFFNSLPLALYYGSPSENGTNQYRLACHAAPEIGYQPEKLFKKDDSPLAFERIHTFNRQKEAKSLPDIKIQQGDQIVSLQDVCEDFVAETPQKPHRLGFQWINLKIGADDISTYNPKTGFETNEELTLALLDRSERDSNVILGLDRGHQHNPNYSMNPLMELIQKSNGCATVFQGRVATLNVAPDSDHGLKGESAKHHKNFTYCIRTTANDPKAWGEKICNVPVREGL